MFNFILFFSPLILLFYECVYVKFFLGFFPAKKYFVSYLTISILSQLFSLTFIYVRQIIPDNEIQLWQQNFTISFAPSSFYFFSTLAKYRQIHTYTYLTNKISFLFILTCVCEYVNLMILRYVCILFAIFS